MKKTFNEIPTFSNYEFNGDVVQNKKGKQMSLKKNGRYQLISDDGKNCDRTPEQIAALMPKLPTKSSDKVGSEKQVISSFGKKQTKWDELMDELKERDDVKRILNEINFKKHDKIYRLSLLKINKEDICVLTSSGLDFVNTTLSDYATGKKKGIAGAKPSTTSSSNKVTKKSQILELTKQGLSPRQIHDQTKIGFSTINVTITVDKIKKLKGAGKTPDEIAEKTGISLSRVKKNY